MSTLQEPINIELTLHETENGYREVINPYLEYNDHLYINKEKELFDRNEISILLHLICIEQEAHDMLKNKLIEIKNKNKYNLKKLKEKRDSLYLYQSILATTKCKKYYKEIDPLLKIKNKREKLLKSYSINSKSLDIVKKDEKDLLNVKKILLYQLQQSKIKLYRLTKNGKLNPKRKNRKLIDDADSDKFNKISENILKNEIKLNFIQNIDITEKNKIV